MNYLKKFSEERVLSKSYSPESAAKVRDAQKVTMRPVESSRGLCFQAEYSFEKESHS